MLVVRPERVSHTYTQRLERPVDAVFPLLCPVRELDWVNGWDPGVVISDSGVAEPDCIFTTGSGAAEAIWVVSEYAPPARIGFVKVTPGVTVVSIGIDLEPADGDASLAHVTYTLTALSARGAEAVRAFTSDHYRLFMRTWEDELNHFLRTGAKLTPAQGR